MKLNWLLTQRIGTMCAILGIGLRSVSIDTSISQVIGFVMLIIGFFILAFSKDNEVKIKDAK